MMRRTIAAASMTALLALGLVGCAGQGADQQASGGSAAPEATQDASPSAQGGETEARSLMEGLFTQVFDNVTIDATVDMEVDAGAASQQVEMETTLLLDYADGEPRMIVAIASDPANDQTDMTMHLVGTEAAVERGGEVALVEVDEGQMGQLMASTSGGAQARAIYDAAQSIALAQEDGQRVVRIVADPAALTAAGTFSQLSEVTSCEANYAFDDEGQIVRCTIEMQGPSAESAGATLVIAMGTDYFDYGTTVVPDLE